MQTIGKASRKLPVTAFVAAALAFGAMAMPPAHALTPCTDELYLHVTSSGITSVSPTNVAIAALTDGEFEMTWDNPDEVNMNVPKGTPLPQLSPGEVPAGTVYGFCAEKSYESAVTGNVDKDTVCKCAEGASCPSEETASSVESVTVDSCFSTLPNGRRNECRSGTFEFKVHLLAACDVSAPWSDTLSADSTYESS